MTCPVQRAVLAVMARWLNRETSFQSERSKSAMSEMLVSSGASGRAAQRGPVER